MGEPQGGQDHTEGLDRGSSDGLTFEASRAALEILLFQEVGRKLDKRSAYLAETVLDPCERFRWVRNMSREDRSLGEKVVVLP